MLFKNVTMPLLSNQMTIIDDYLSSYTVSAIHICYMPSFLFSLCSAYSLYNFPAIIDSYSISLWSFSLPHYILRHHQNRYPLISFTVLCPSYFSITPHPSRNSTLSHPPFSLIFIFSTRHSPLL